MSARAKRTPITEPEAAARRSETAEPSVANPTREDQVRRRAYEIYMEHGGLPGRELDDWLQAENEVEIQRWVRAGGSETTR